MTELQTVDRDTEAADRDHKGQMLLDLSNAVVRVHKQYYGKGPTKARAHAAHDLLTVILEGGFTRAERTLIEYGRGDEVARSRAAIEQAVEGELRAAVEQIVHRGVRSFMSANDPHAGLQVEVFVLSSDSLGGRSDLADRAKRARDQHREIIAEHRALRAEQVQTRRARPVLGARFEP